MLNLSEQSDEDIDPAHLPGVLEGLGQATRGEFATDAEVEAAFRRFKARGLNVTRVGIDEYPVVMPGLEPGIHLASPDFLLKFDG